MQGMLARGRTRAAQAAPSTSVSWPWWSRTQATERMAVPSPQLAEHGPRDVTFHLQEEKTPGRGWASPKTALPPPGSLDGGSARTGSKATEVRKCSPSPAPRPQGPLHGKAVQEGHLFSLASCLPPSPSPHDTHSHPQSCLLTKGRGNNAPAYGKTDLDVGQSCPRSPVVSQQITTDIFQSWD